MTKKSKKFLKEGTIYFSLPNGRLLADALDIYNYLFRLDYKIAEEFMEKANIASDKLVKRQGESARYTLGQQEWVKKPIEEIKKEKWYKKLI